MADWVTISALATATGTLVLATATFGSVRSANRAARVAEESLLAGIRPLLVPSHPDDLPIKVGFSDDHYVHTPGGGGTAEIGDDAIYLTMSLRNVGNGIAVLHGWRFDPTLEPGDFERPPVDLFRRLNRDIYIASGEVGFWQGAFRDAGEPEFDELAAFISDRKRIFVDVLYGDQFGGQRAIGRFTLTSRADGPWLVNVVRHWNVDRPDPR